VRSVGTDCEECGQCLEHKADLQRLRRELEEYRAQSKKATEHFSERIRKLKQQAEGSEQHLVKVKQVMHTMHLKMNALEESRAQTIARSAKEAETWKAEQAAAALTRQAEMAKQREQAAAATAKLRQEKQALEAARKDLDKQVHQLERAERAAQKQCEALTAQVRDLRDREAKAAPANEKAAQLLGERTKECEDLRAELGALKKARDQQGREHQQAVRGLRQELEAEALRRAQRDQEADALRQEAAALRGRWPSPVANCPADQLPALAQRVEAYRADIEEALRRTPSAAPSPFNRTVGPPSRSTDPFAGPLAGQCASTFASSGDFLRDWPGEELRVDQLLQNLRTAGALPPIDPW
jgi:chromosome segregation ATPase